MSESVFLIVDSSGPCRGTYPQVNSRPQSPNLEYSAGHTRSERWESPTSSSDGPSAQGAAQVEAQTRAGYKWRAPPPRDGVYRGSKSSLALRILRDIPLVHLHLILMIERAEEGYGLANAI